MRKPLMEYKECLRSWGKTGNRLFQNRPGSNVHADERGPYAERSVKPAYNVQIAVENYFLIHGYVSNDRTDYNS